MPLILLLLLGLGAFAAVKAHGATVAPGAPGAGPAAHGASDPIVQAAMIAYAGEQYPSRLRSFAGTLRPDYAAQAGLLESKAASIDAGMMPGVQGG